jgi:hypothetical protein
MAAGVLIDTSFLITLAGPTRANHAAARRYWQHFLESQRKPIKLDDGFDRAFFDPSGQRDFTDGLTDGNNPAS